MNGHVSPNSFPYVHFSYQALTVAVVWLAAVIFFWVWKWGGIRDTASVVCVKESEVREGKF